ncbi:MAG: 30S ribosomal protein S7 [Candidatus Dojkabacteria bacterium]|nr:30S ribosomal protein S7 [Candidatus Dojkabacteria bacterium]MDQ7021566.1 30S ribosomal protein S7 [Candidatus Dojkabacteria bacterium]
MRGKQIPRRKVAPDQKYNSELVAKLINYIMMDGKKVTARKIVYKAIEEIAKQTKTKGIEGLEQAIENVKPRIEVRSRRVGGSNYQVPTPVSEHRQLTLALRWIIDSARNSRGSKEFYEVLAREIVAAFNKEGNAMKKKEDVKKMADANKAFAQFA